MTRDWTRESSRLVNKSGFGYGCLLKIGSFLDGLFCVCSWDETFKRELEVYKETKDVGDIW